MSVYYPSNCDDLVPDHICDPCEEIEQGRVRSFSFIKSTFAFVDPSDPTEWEIGFASGDIILIPQTRGSYDGGSENLGQGFGDQAERLLGYNHTLVFFDPNYAQNCNFYNTIKRSRQYKGAYRSSSKIHLIEATIQAIPKNPVEDDTNSEVLWNVTVKWSHPDSPCPYDVPPGIFDACTAFAD